METFKMRNMKIIDNFGFREIAVEALTGSHNYNLHTPTSDEDYKYFVVPTFEDLYGGKFFSSSMQSDLVDYTCHDIRQLSNLIWKANINFIEVLFSTQLWYTRGLEFLFENAEKWVGMNLPASRNATYGMHLQKMGDLHKGTEKTQGLVNTFGYDTKQACHALRCLYVLEKYGKSESMKEALWFNDGKKRDTLLEVKAGKYTEAEFLDIVEHWHTHVWGELSKNYNDTRANNELKEELDSLMLEFVKSRFSS